MKRLLSIIILICLACALAGCSGSDEKKETTTLEAASETTPAETLPIIELNPEDIAWEIEQVESDGGIRFLISYTNGSPYKVTKVEVRMEPKADMTDEEKAAFDIYSEEEMEQIFISGYNAHFADTNEKTPQVPCEISASGLEVSNPVQFNAMEDVKLSVYYLGGNGAIYKTTQDLKTGEYSSELYKEKAYNWYESDLGALIPKIECEVLTSTIGYNSFQAIMYGAKRADFDNYKKACAQAGFDKDVRENESFYGAKNSDGISLRIYFFENTAELDVNVEKE